jgi:hypothetical protein
MNPSESLYRRYELEKSTWLHLHPDANPEQIEAALRGIAKRLGL